MAAVIALVAVIGLAVACRGAARHKLGITQIQGLPKDAQQRRAQEAAAKASHPGSSPPRCCSRASTRSRSCPRSSASNAGSREPGIAAAIGPASAVGREIPGLVVVSDPPAARILLVLDREPQGGPATDIIEQLRERLPELTKQAGLDTRVRIAGDTALAEETVRTITHDLVRIGIAAFLVNFLLLALFLRALIAPRSISFSPRRWRSRRASG